MKLSAVFNELMRKHHRQAVLLGGSRASTPEEFFCFHHNQVKMVHFHKCGVGKGIWFRLHCGRVVDEAANAAIRELDMYDDAAAWSGRMEVKLRIDPLEALAARAPAVPARRSDWLMEQYFRIYERLGLTRDCS